MEKSSKLRTGVAEVTALDFQGLVTAFIEASLSDSRRAEEILARHPEIANAGLYAALVLGEREQIEQTLQEIPEFAAAKGGPRHWEPLLYVCFSRFSAGNSSRSAHLVETARLLLSHGANPNAFYIDAHWPDNPLPCLYGATGLNNNPSLALALLEAGANPNDNESLYHSTEHTDLKCLELLLQHGANPSATNALKHMLDREDVRGVELLLKAGADPNQVNPRGETALHWAVWRSRSPRIVAALLDRGADLDARRNDGRTAYALAVQTSQTEVAALLEARGAKTDLSPLDRFIASCAAASPQDLDRLLAAVPNVAPSPELGRLIPDLTMNHHTRAVQALLAAGLPVNARGELGATALHWACWKGYADLVKLLFDHGASLTIEDDQFHGTPPGWFMHGLHNCAERAGDYPEVARLLLAAGAVFTAADLPTGIQEVDAVLVTI